MMRIQASLGIISEDPLLRKDLSIFAERYGFSAQVSIAPQSWKIEDLERYNQISCWLVDEPFFDLASDELAQYIADLAVPVILGLEPFSREHELREREFSLLIKKLIQHLHPNQSNEVFDIWVLAASLGGPEAVKEFLDALPQDIPASFLYAQHLDEVGSKALADVIGRDAKLPVVAIDGMCELAPGVIYKVPVDSSIDFTNGVCFKTGSAWQGEYTPSIDELLRRVSFTYGNRANVIVFSGMGEDGADTAKDLARRGSLVWAQSEHSAVSDMMPKSVIEKRICQRIAAPKDLAMLMTAYYKNTGIS
ncbi:chemotaxis protein CheB [Oleiphilus sp. HI0125]|uniref:chemotaxis protein CheB n=1 Tax=Oleiphilus sp. HI0125 TaxID=1822266 RepID=UPI0009ED3502|nr:chemotaxis protein CheB [Oleiphilus sp. HI0125]